jgi:hypothetical protein
MKLPTPVMIKALKIAADRPQGAICAIAGVHVAAEQAPIGGMDRRGYVDWPAIGLGIVVVELIPDTLPFRFHGEEVSKTR